MSYNVEKVDFVVKLMYKMGGDSMSKSNKTKLLGMKYDYYSVIKEKSDKIAERQYNNNNEIFKSQLYNLVLNMCNQFVYDYTYIFSKQDLYFIADYDINIHKLLNEFKNDIKIMRNRKEN